MSPIGDLATLLRSLAPSLSPGEFVFTTLREQPYGAAADLEPVASCLEDEGLTLVLPRERAEAAGLDVGETFRRLTLGVHSSLTAVGLTAAVAEALAREGISANVIAAYHHDHVFVPADRAEDAVRALESLEQGAWSGWVPVLRVEDARKSADFYVRSLGFEFDWEHRFADDFPAYVQVSRGPLTLHLSEHEGGGTTEADFFVRVPDVDTVYEVVVESGVTPDSEPTDQEYGMRDFCVVDPDGNRITLGTPTTFPTEQHREEGAEP